MILLVVALAGAGAVASPANATSQTVDLVSLRNEVINAAPAGSTARVDHVSGQVVLRIAGSMPAAVASAVARHAREVRVETAVPPITTLSNLYGGMGMTSSTGYSCTTGFMASQDQYNYVITAGHCTGAANRWNRKGDWLGWSVSSVFGSDGDFGLILEQGLSFNPQPGVNTQYGIVGIQGTETAVAGQELCKMGNNSRYTCGTVLAVDVSVAYPQTVVNGLIETTICSVAGDSGGPLMTPYRVGPMLYAYGVGILSGGGGSCSAGTFRSYYQPIGEILDVHGLVLHPA